jgi:hypothetical protein
MCTIIQICLYSYRNFSFVTYTEDFVKSGPLNWLQDGGGKLYEEMVRKAYMTKYLFSLFFAAYSAL